MQCCSLKTFYVDWFVNPHSEKYTEVKKHDPEKLTLYTKDLTIFDNLYINRNKLRSGFKLGIITGIVLSIFFMGLFGMSATGCFASYSFTVTLPMALGLSSASLLLITILPGYILHRFNLVEKANPVFYQGFENGDYVPLPKEFH